MSIRSQINAAGALLSVATPPEVGYKGKLGPDNVNIGGSIRTRGFGLSANAFGSKAFYSFSAEGERYGLKPGLAYTGEETGFSISEDAISVKAYGYGIGVDFENNGGSLSIPGFKLAVSPSEGTVSLEVGMILLKFDGQLLKRDAETFRRELNGIGGIGLRRY